MGVTHVKLGYKATQNEDGTLVIHDVPIFTECERGDFKADARWIDAAVQKAQRAAREGYFPPLHIRHHEEATEQNGSVRAAGYFRITGTRPITYRTSRRVAIFADLVITDPMTQEDVLARRLPYRSVEILNVDQPSIDSLALLDHEAPYLELPLLMVSEVTDSSNTKRDQMSVANATFSNPWLARGTREDSGVVACFRRGHSIHLFYQDSTMSKTHDKPDSKNGDTGGETEPKGRQNFEKDDDNNEGDDENMVEEGLDVSSVVKAIESGEISVADMDAILEAIQKQRSETDSDVQSPDAAETPAPAAAPGSESMRMSAEMAQMKGKFDALKAQIEARDAADKRRSDVAVALKRLEGRPLGSDVESKLNEFHENHGPEAFKAYVDSLAQALGTLPSDDGSDAAAFSGTAGAPEVALKYQTSGTDAIDKASRFCREWQDLRDRGLVRMSQDRYVQINMERAGFAAPEAKSA